MVCLKCGHCCYWFNIRIIRPQYIFKIVNKEDITPEKLMLKPGRVFCPYLKKDDEQFCCSVHHHPWFKFTGCYSFIQIENDNSPCRIGNWYFNDIHGNEFYKNVFIPKWEFHTKGRR